MNKGVIFGLGSLFGGAVASFVTFVFVKRKDNAEKDAEIEEVRRYYKDKYGETKPKTEVKEEKKEPEKQEKMDFSERDSVKEGGEKYTKSAYTDYTKYSRKYKTPAFEEPDEDEKYTKMTSKPGEFPVEITGSQYDFNNGFTKKNLLYFEEDGWFVDQEDRIVAETEEYFGYDNLGKFGDTGEYGTLYLRDEIRQTDYRIYNMEGKTYDQYLIDQPGGVK